MNQELLNEFTNFIQSKIDKRNAFIEKPEYNKNVVKYMDNEIDFLERVEREMYGSSRKFQRLIDKQKLYVFNLGRESGNIQAQTGRFLSLDFMASNHV